MATILALDCAREKEANSCLRNWYVCALLPLAVPASHKSLIAPLQKLAQLPMKKTAPSLLPLFLVCAAPFCRDPREQKDGLWGEGTPNSLTQSNEGSGAIGERTLFMGERKWEGSFQGESNIHTHPHILLWCRFPF